MADPIDTSTTPSDSLLLYPNRELFDYGVIPIPKLTFPDPFQTLISLKQKLLLSQSSNHRVDSHSLAESLQIPVDHAEVVLQTLSSVLHAKHDPLVADVAAGANLYDLILFLYIQTYKKLIPKTHRDSAAVSDVWPSNSPFDGCVSSLSPMQLVRSNSRRFVLSQAHEEAHQLSYLQKHGANIVSLLAEPTDGESEESQGITVEQFEHLELLFRVGDAVSERVPLRKVAPFFATSDPDTPSVSAPIEQVRDWILGKISTALEYLSEKDPLNNTPGKDVVMEDSFGVKPSATYIEGIYKSSVVKHAADCIDASVKVLNCHDSLVYVLAPLKYAMVHGCSDTTVLLGAVGKAVKVEYCERVHVIAAAKRIYIANCRECIFFLGVNHRPLVGGENHKVQVAPYNTFYPQLEEHLAEVGVETSINRWNEPFLLGLLDPQDSLSHPVGMSDAKTEPVTPVAPDQFATYMIPGSVGTDSASPTKHNPFQLPDAYFTSQQEKQKNVSEMKQMLRDAPLEDNRKQELSSVLHIHFKDWLYASGNIRQLYSLQSQ